MLSGTNVSSVAEREVVLTTMIPFRLSLLNLPSFWKTGIHRILRDLHRLLSLQWASCAEADTNVPRGMMVVPSENVKSFTATRVIRTKKFFFSCKIYYEGEGTSLTVRNRIQSLRLFDETIEPMHLVK